MWLYIKKKKNPDTDSNTEWRRIKIAVVFYSWVHKVGQHRSTCFHKTVFVGETLPCCTLFLALTITMVSKQIFFIWEVGINNRPTKSHREECGWNETHLVSSPCVSMISAAGSPACGGTLPRHLLWHRPVNGTWIRLGPWCRSSLDRRWVTFASPNPLLLRHTLPLSRLWLCHSERRRAGQERKEDGRPVCPQMSRSVFRGRNTWIEEAKVYF